MNEQRAKAIFLGSIAAGGVGLALILVVGSLLVFRNAKTAQRSTEPQGELPATSSSTQRSTFPDDVIGRWNLLIYAGKEDWLCEQGDGELLLIEKHQCRLHILDEPLVPLRSGLQKTEEWFDTGQKRLVYWKRSQDNILVTVIDNESQEVDWRGSYVRDTLYEACRQQGRLGIVDAQLANLGVCKKYWYDLYDEDGSPRRVLYDEDGSPRRVKINGKGYSP